MPERTKAPPEGELLGAQQVLIEQLARGDINPPRIGDRQLRVCLAAVEYALSQDDPTRCCVTCGAVITEGTTVMHNHWHDQVPCDRCGRPAGPRPLVGHRLCGDCKVDFEAWLAAKDAEATP